MFKDYHNTYVKHLEKGDNLEAIVKRNAELKAKNKMLKWDYEELEQEIKEMSMKYDNLE